VEGQRAIRKGSEVGEKVGGGGVERWGKEDSAIGESRFLEKEVYGTML
jgi:hypothetical protein